MRPLAPIAVVLALASCQEGAPRLPPADRLYFPTAVAFLPGAPDGGTLAVASSDFDNRYTYGSVTAIPLDALALPAFGDPVPAGGPPEIDLGTTDDDRVFIDAFASGQVGVVPLPDGGARLFFPTRGADNVLFSVDVDPAARRISCVRQGSEAATPANDCTVGALSLSAAEAEGQGKPRAIEPVGVAADPATGDVFVTHRVAATDPLGTSNNPESYLVRLQAESPFAPEFWSIGVTGANAVALASRFAFVAGFSQAPLLRWVDRIAPWRTGNAAIDGDYVIAQARDLALSTDQSELYLVGRQPPTLVVLQVGGLSAPVPTFRVVRGVLLPADPNHLAVLPRAGKGDVVAITCTEEGQVLLYDADVGDVVGQVAVGVGTRPFGIAYELLGAGARLYVTSFHDGQVAVVDIPDLALPEDVRLVARLGKSQQCIMTGTPCD